MNKGMKLFFTLSIILNVMLLGIGGGMIYKHYSHSPVEDMHAEMSPEARHIVARTMQNAFRDGRETMEQARQAKKELKDIIAAETFNADLFSVQAEKLQAIKSEMSKKRIDVTKELAAQLSQADRKILAEKFSKGYHGHSKDHKKSGKEPHSFLTEQGAASNTAKDAVKPVESPELPDNMPPQP